MSRSGDHGRNPAGDRLEEASDHAGRAGQSAEDAGRHLGEAGRQAAEAMEAGASGALERTGEAARAASRTVTDAAASAAGAAADAVGSAAGAASRAGNATVQAAGSVAGGVRAAAGRIGESLGGWWSTAAATVAPLPSVEQQRCVARFEAEEGSPDELTVDLVLTAYALGYLAASNPEYGGRTFAQVEPDLRRGFEGSDVEYGRIRDYSREGYERRTLH